MTGPTSRDLPVPARALAVGAHPDDIEFGAGATLARWASAGCEVSLLICTDGSKGTWDPQADLAALVAVREAEARAAAEALGAKGEVVFLGVTDGECNGVSHAKAHAHGLRADDSHRLPRVVSIQDYFALQSI